MSSELFVEHLRKVFDAGKPAVDGVSFTIAAGEIVAVNRETLVYQPLA